MTSREIYIRHRFEGGWATDFGPSTDIAPDGAGVLRMPFLTTAEDILYEFDGGPRKAPGTIRLSSELESGATVKGLFDYWISGTGGSSTQHRVCHVGTKIKKDDADGTFTDLFTGLTSDAAPAYAVLEDILVMANDADTPKSWDGTTAQDLAGSPPSFAFAAAHRNRMWAAGDESNPSRLYYSALLDPEDWTGAGSGNIDIDPNDNDRITGIIGHKNELWVFKGPYRGSIHRISGSSPTGGDAFARSLFISGLGAAGHNTLFRFGDDIGFLWSDGTVRSLQATSAFGDFIESALSRPINGWIRDHVNFSRLKHAWAADWSDFGVVLFALPIDANQDNNIILAMDYRFSPPRWSSWPSFSSAGNCLASVVDSANNDRRIVMSGGTDGFIRKLGQATRSIDGMTALSYRMDTPYLTYATPIVMKTISAASLAVAPKNDGNLTFGWARDNHAEQTETIAQGGTDVLGTASADEFTLGTSTLGGQRFVDRFAALQEGGEFRSIQYSVRNSANNEDVEIHAIGATIVGGSWSMEN